MNVNKKLGRFKQWAGERMGGEAKTSVSEDFQALEEEMKLRYEGMDRLHKSMTVYVKSLSKTKEADDREKGLPVSNLGSTMISHGEDFENDSEFGSCLIGLGRSNERIARLQENYVQRATASWLEGLERSLAQMKEYQAARKKLENRRLAYDASLSKMQKAKREDFRVEEELRSQKAKYEESSEDVYRRMQDIKEAEVDSVADLTAFLDAELEHYDRCREVLVQLKQDWPAAQSPINPTDDRRTRVRTNTAHTYQDRLAFIEDEPAVTTPESRPSIRSSRGASSNHGYGSPNREPLHDPSAAMGRSTLGRSHTFQGPTKIPLDGSGSSATIHRPARGSPDSPAPSNGRAHLRPTHRVHKAAPNDVFGDPLEEESYAHSIPDQAHGGRPESPAISHGSAPSRTASSTTLNAGISSGRKAPPPPPPPSRAKKPPPPPPIKRSALSASSVLC